MPGFKEFVWLVAVVVASLPEKVKRTAVRLLSGCSRIDQQEMVYGTFGMQPHQTRGVIGLVKSEVIRLDPVATPGAGYEELGKVLKMPGRPPVVGVYTRGDVWVPEIHLPKFKEVATAKTDEVIDLGSDQNEPSTLVKGRPVVHGVPLDEEHLEPMAALLASR